MTVYILFTNILLPATSNGPYKCACSADSFKRHFVSQYFHIKQRTIHTKHRYNVHKMQECELLSTIQDHLRAIMLSFISKRTVQKLMSAQHLRTLSPTSSSSSPKTLLIQFYIYVNSFSSHIFKSNPYISIKQNMHKHQTQISEELVPPPGHNDIFTPFLSD